MEETVEESLQAALEYAGNRLAELLKQVASYPPRGIWDVVPNMPAEQLKKMFQWTVGAAYPTGVSVRYKKWAFKSRQTHIASADNAPHWQREHFLESWVIWNAYRDRLVQQLTLATAEDRWLQKV